MLAHVRPGVDEDARAVLLDQDRDPPPPGSWARPDRNRPNHCRSAAPRTMCRTRGSAPSFLPSRLREGPGVGGLRFRKLAPLAPPLDPLPQAGGEMCSPLHSACLAEQPAEIVRGGRRKLLDRLPAQFAQEPRGIGDERRLAGLAAVRHRRQERRIGLDQQPIGGDRLGRLLQLRGVPEVTMPDIDT